MEFPLVFQILLLHEDSTGTFSRVFDLDERDLRDEEADASSGPFEGGRGQRN